MREWLLDAKCRGEDTNIFFSEDPRDGFKHRRQALEHCAACSVVDACLADFRDWALKSPHGWTTWVSTGIFGGTQVSDRRRMKLIQPKTA